MNRSLSRQISDALLIPEGISEAELLEAIEADPEAAAYLDDMKALDGAFKSWEEAGPDLAPDEAAFEAMAARIEERIEAGLKEGPDEALEPLEFLEDLEDPGEAPRFLAEELEAGDPEQEEQVAAPIAAAPVAVKEARPVRAAADPPRAAAARAGAPAKVASIEAARGRRGGVPTAWWIGGLAAAAAVLLGLFAGTATFTSNDSAQVSSEAAPMGVVMPGSTDVQGAAVGEMPTEAAAEEAEGSGGQDEEEAWMAAARGRQEGAEGEIAIAGDPAPAPQAAALPMGVGGSWTATPDQGALAEGGEEDMGAGPMGEAEGASRRRARRHSSPGSFGRSASGSSAGPQDPFEAGGSSSGGSSSGGRSSGGHAGSGGGGAASTGSTGSSSGTGSTASRAGGSPLPSRAQAMSTLRAALRRARSECRVEGPAQLVTLRVEVSAEGQIRRVALSRLPAAMSAHQSCVQAAIGRTRIAGWSGGASILESELEL